MSLNCLTDNVEGETLGAARVKCSERLKVRAAQEMHNSRRGRVEIFVPVGPMSMGCIVRMTPSLMQACDTRPKYNENKGSSTEDQNGAVLVRKCFNELRN